MKRKIRCAIYTRKSSEEGLDQEFNSLDAQREACGAYVTSQKAEGWVLLPEAYDDGGLSGGTLKRPAMQQLLNAVDAGQIDQIVVYKIDRLTRSLADFAKIVDRLDAAGASFVSVTQSFNTATSMGRLTLNMLLSFAQFEREVTAERIRDKIAASKKKGLWMGGTVPLGYLPNGRTLQIAEEEAPMIRRLYALYLEGGSLDEVKRSADAEDLRTRHRIDRSGRAHGAKLLTKTQIHRILINPIYAGRIRHKTNVYDGQHKAIIDPDMWERVQDQLSNQAARLRGFGNATHPSPLAGKLFDETGDRLTPSHANRKGKRHRYYISRRLIASKREEHPEAWRLPALEVEDAIRRVVTEHLSHSTFLPDLIPNLEAAELSRIRKRCSDNIIAHFAGGQSASDWASLIHDIRIAQGQIAVRLAPLALAGQLGIPEDRLNETILTITVPFQRRRRGVETKITLGAGAARTDCILAKNVVAARRWYAEIKSGATFSVIAARENTSTRRIQHMIELAFLAPDIVEQITSGTQAVGLTSQWAKQNAIPADWDRQREIIAAL